MIMYKVPINISDKNQRESTVKNSHVSYIWGSLFLRLTKQFICSCTAVPLRSHVVLTTCEAHIAGPPYLSPVDISLLVPSAVVSQITLHRHLFMALRYDFASALETDDNRSAPDRGCVRDVPGFLQLRNYMTCKLIF